MTDPYAAYLETNVLGATPLELVRMLYAGALDAVRTARTCLANGQIAERARAVSKAVEIVAELNNSLDLSAGELPQHLARLYDYIQRRLLDGNFQQTDAPFAEAQGLLETVAEAWAQVSDIPADHSTTPSPAGNQPEAGTPQSSSPWGQVYDEPVSVGSNQGWTL